MFKTIKTYLMLTIAFMLPLQQAWAIENALPAATAQAEPIEEPSVKKPKESRAEKKARKKAEAEAKAEAGENEITETSENAIVKVTEPCWRALLPQPNPERWTSLSVDEQYAALLLMIGSSFTPRFVGKYLFEKGEFALGIELAGKRTLDLQYFMDSRFGEGTLILTEINVIDAFGNPTTILNRPIDPVTGQLRPIKQTGMISQEEYDGLVFPVSIEGPLLVKLMASKNWLEHVNADEIRERAVSSVLKLKTLGRLRWLRTFLFRDLLKYTFRFAVFAGILVALGIVQVHSGKGSMTRALYELFSGDQITQTAPEPELSVAEVATTTIAEVQASELIDPTEKAWLVADTQAHNEKASLDVTFEDLDFRLLSSDVPGRTWIFKPSENRIFMTTVQTEFSDKKTFSKFQDILEIPADKMPLTHAKIMGLFTYSPQATVPEVSF